MAEQTRADTRAQERAADLVVTAEVLAAAAAAPPKKAWVLAPNHATADRWRRAEGLAPCQVVVLATRHDIARAEGIPWLPHDEVVLLAGGARSDGMEISYFLDRVKAKAAQHAGDGQ